MMYLDKSTGWWRGRDDTEEQLNAVIAFFEMLHTRLNRIDQKLDRLVPDGHGSDADPVQTKET